MAMNYNKTGKVKPQSNREKEDIPRAMANVVAPKRNPAQRPIDADRRQPGTLTVGPVAVFSKVPYPRPKRV